MKRGSAVTWAPREVRRNLLPRKSRRTTAAAPRLRGAISASLGAALAVVCIRAFAGVASAPSTGAPPRPDEVVVRAIAWLGVGLSAWLALGCLLGLAALLPGTAGRFAEDVAHRVTPAAVQRALSLVLGAGLASVALPPAPVSVAGTGPVASVPGGTAAPGSSRGPALVPTDASARLPVPGAALGPGFTPTSAASTLAPAARPVTKVRPPERPDAAARRAVAPAHGAVVTPGFRPTMPTPVSATDRSRLLAPTPRPASATHDLVTVRRGDTLWSIAQRHLGPGASDVEVARSWPAWHDANRELIGDDPDLIRPGQQLRPP